MFHTTEHKDLIWEILAKKTLTTEEVAWIETFLKDKANVGIRHRWGWTPIFMAARNGHLVVVQLLIKKGADIKAKNVDGQTPLYRATLGGHVQVVQLLIEKGADINTKDNDGWTPLYAAVWYHHLEVVKLLIEKGANIQVKNKHGYTPLRVATWNGYLEILQWMIEEVEINLPREEIIELISKCINNSNKKENNFTLLPLIRDFETDFAKNLSIILKYYEDLKKATPINLLINLSNICTDPKNKKTLADKIVLCERNKPLTPFENRLIAYTSTQPFQEHLNFLNNLKRENMLNQSNQQSEKEKQKQTFSMNG